MEERRKILSLQVLRASAAVAVAWAHAEGIHEALTDTPIQHSRHIGTIGVDVFFVLSGFIIARAALRAPTGWTFFQQRWIRVGPLYYLATIPWLIAAAWTGKLAFEPLVASITFWPVGREGAIIPLLPSGWTLCYEMLFYSAVALMVGRRWWGPAIGAAVFALLVVMQTIGAGGVFDFLGNPILVEFLIGALVARTLRPLSAAFGVAAVVVSLCLLAFWSSADLAGVHDGRFAHDGSLSWIRLAVFGPSAAGLVIGALILEPWAKGPVVCVLAYLGDASYSIYLVHLFAQERLLSLWPETGIPAAVIIPVGIVLSVGVGVGFYELVEKPLLRMIRGSRQPVAAALAT